MPLFRRRRLCRILFLTGLPTLLHTDNSPPGGLRRQKGLFLVRQDHGIRFSFQPYGPFFCHIILRFCSRAVVFCLPTAISAQHGILICRAVQLPGVFLALLRLRILLAESLHRDRFDLLLL